MSKWEKIRADFPVFNNCTYFFTNGGGPVSKSYVAKAQELLTAQSELGRGVIPAWDAEVENIRAMLARTVGATPSEIAFITNTAQAMGSLTGMFPKTFEILTMKDDFPTSFVPWIHHGHTVRLVEPEKNGAIPVSLIEQHITPNTRILILSHVMFRSGYRHNLEAIGALCKKHGLILIVDATQSYPINEIDVKACHIDILIFHTYKWAAAGYCSGGMYVSRQLLEKYTPATMGWYNVTYPNPDFDTTQDYTQFTPKKDATVFEPGTPAFVNILLLGEAMRTIETLGIADINAYVHTLISYLHEQAAKHGIEVLSNFEPQHASAIQRLKITPEQFLRLEQHKIMARYKNNMLTIGINFYNNKADIDAIFAALQ
ncbi:aminotransferase class V-fold PLP-dependent enzyme [Chitinophaga qingshengii]|uniref:Aminotransferase class V-fold PLP-dependent enzyme n=1 Tax=Chitinophaga qingshengii TaxID=1569794 RepID=A0ABR7TGG8_9BACT|nr:aminotransferase class V-fold PLP-dependent enzyme [Chitinophaga qingshengii]MBC9929551.1 aminotransferase class V-fold PLP-dependent enzyme [Chitinophaga qingshengii]